MSTDNIGLALQQVAQAQPNSTAIVELTAFRGDHFETETHSYAALEARCSAYVNGFYDLGVRKGDRVAVLVPAGARLYALTFALFRLGAVVVFVDPGIGIKRMGKCLDDAEPKFFVGVLKAQIARILFGWGRRTIKSSVLVGPSWLAPRHNLRYIHANGQKSLPRDLPQTGGEDEAALLFTSGSTGAPKGVVYTHNIFMNQVRLLKQTYKIEPGEVDLPTFPLFGLFDPALGMTTVVPDMDPTRPAKADPRRLIAAIRQFGVTNLFGSPALLDTLTRFTEAHELHFGSLRRTLSAGAPVGRAVIRRVRKMLPAGADLFTPYGATECLPVASISATELMDQEVEHKNATGGGVCVGVPINENEIKIIAVTDDPIPSLDDAISVEPGTVGEILVLGPTTSQSYYGRPEANLNSKVMGKQGARQFHRMGDLGYIDAQGRLWFCGRKAHRIKQSSGFVCAVPIEQVLNQHHKVYRSAIVSGLNQSIVAVLEMESGSQLDEVCEFELRALCASAEIKVRIDAFVRHGKFPVDIRHNAKIDRPSLSRWVQRKGIG